MFRPAGHSLARIGGSRIGGRESNTSDRMHQSRDQSFYHLVSTTAALIAAKSGSAAAPSGARPARGQPVERGQITELHGLHKPGSAGQLEDHQPGATETLCAAIAFTT